MHLCMQTFKKVIISCSVFIAILLIISAVVIEPMIQFGMYYYCDGNYRDHTAGEYELFFMGDSDGLAAFSPSAFQKYTGIKSYNLCGEKNTSTSEYYLLNKELKRNPVRTVFLQVGVDTFQRDYSNEHSEGNAVTLMRTNSFIERIGFLAKYEPIDRWLDIYSGMMTRGILCWERQLTHNNDSRFNEQLKGWHKLDSVDLSLNEKEALASYNTEELDCEFRSDRVEEFLSIINMCKEYGAEVIVVMVPMADKYIWKKANCDEIYDRIYSLCVENNTPFVDFNLFKDRYELFSDKYSYKDSIHLSAVGAESFTKRLAEIYSCYEIDDSFFYDNYELMKADSPYAQYLNNN